MCMYFKGCPLMKIKPLTEKSELNSPMFFQLLENLTQGFPSTLAFIFSTFIRFCMQNNKKSNNQKFKVLRRNTNN